MDGATRLFPQHLCSWQANLTIVVLSKSARDVLSTVAYGSSIVDDRG